MIAVKARIFRISLFFLNILSLLDLFSRDNQANAAEANTVEGQAWSLASTQLDGGSSQPSPLSDDYGTISISWTAPGDDSTIGRADHYVIKYSEAPLADSNWDQAASVANPPAPIDPGQAQSFFISGLNAGVFYYLAIKTYDDVGNISLISNVAAQFASGIQRPLLLEPQIDSANSLATLYARTVNSHLAVYYEFALDTTPSFIDPRIDVALIADTAASVIFGSLQPDIYYFWRCRAMAQDHSDSSLWTNYDSFQMNHHDIISPQVTITSPADGDTITADTVQIAWEAHDNDQIAEYFVGYSTDSGQNWHQIAQGVDSSGSYNWLLPQTGNQIIIGVLYLDRAQNAGGDTVSIYRVITSISDNVNLPAEFSLEQSYPNPFNAAATIRYSLPVASHVTLEIYDLLGNLVATAIEEEQSPGFHQYLWQAGQIASGTYLYRIKAGKFEMVKKMTLLK